jgi:hypothetical protein
VRNKIQMGPGAQKLLTTCPRARRCQMRGALESQARNNGCPWVPNKGALGLGAKEGVLGDPESQKGVLGLPVGKYGVLELLGSK